MESMKSRDGVKFLRTFIDFSGYDDGHGNDRLQIPKTTKHESLSAFVYRKLSDLSVSLFCRESTPATLSVSLSSQFKMVVHSIIPEIIVVFKVAELPEYFLSSGKDGCMIAEKVSSDPKFCTYMCPAHNTI